MLITFTLFQHGGQSSPHKHSYSENGSGLLSRWLSSHYHGGVHDEKTVARHTVNLLTSTIKVDADQTDLRFCFRIISPMKIYTLQVLLFLKNSWMCNVRLLAKLVIVRESLLFLNTSNV